MQQEDLWYLGDILCFLNKIILVHIVTPEVYFVLDPRKSRVGKKH